MSKSEPTLPADQGPQQVRFGDYVHEVTVQAARVSYSHLMPRVEYDASGEEKPFKPGNLKLRPLDIYRLLQPYVSSRFIEQARAVIPLALYLGLFQFLVLRQPVREAALISGGLLAVMVGLMLFMEGLKLGLMPFGEVIGNTLPRRVGLPVVLTIAFILGVGVTFAEPAIGALQVAGSIVDPAKAPYLFTLLTTHAWLTVLVVGAGVGLAAILGTLRFVYQWSLKPLIYASLIPTLGIGVVLHFHPELSKIVGLAWDCGAVTTGPVTVPLVLALGIGVASAVGKGNSSLSGFGIVTLASVFPILGVSLLGLVISLIIPPDAIIASARSAAQAVQGGEAAWFEVSPGADIILGIRAIVPLVLFLVFVLSVVLRQRLPNAGIIRYGIGLSIAGMCVFNVGLTYGLSRLGGQTGSMVPGAFTTIQGMASSPLYAAGVGVVVAALFAWVLGFGSTLAEPALNALGMTVENLTSGTFKKKHLMYAVSFGVALGIMLGVLKIIFNFPVMYMILPGYALALVLTHFSSEEFANVAWDSAGVTTGPVTVPLVLAMGLGFGTAVGATEGFGILAAASFCPIVSVLVLGLYLQRRARLQSRITEETHPSTEVILE